MVGVEEDVTAVAELAYRTLLLSDGQPLQLDVPPVPSQRPSPGHVPALCSFVRAGEEVAIDGDRGWATSVGDDGADELFGCSLTLIVEIWGDCGN